MRAAEIERIRALFTITLLPGGRTHVAMPTARRGRHKMGDNLPDEEVGAWMLRTWLLETRQV